MNTPCCEVYAIRYGRHERTAGENFISPPTDHDAAMPMDYFIWAIRSETGRHVVVDTGFGAEAAARRGRTLLRCPTEGLRRIGIDPVTVEDVVITHLHYDHAGNIAKFPAARFWLQEREMQFSTGRYMCQRFFNLAYDPEDVVRMVRHAFDGRVHFVDGEHEVIPGVTVHRVGGHTAGLQIVRVHTRHGYVVLASDLFHYYANFENASPFPIVYRPDEMLDGFAAAQALASSRRLLVPGHDPLVMQRFEPEPLDADFTVRLSQPRS